MKSTDHFELPALPPTVRLLLDDDWNRLAAEDSTLPVSPEDCRTCSGQHSFRWYARAAADFEGHEPDEVVTFTCPCIDQWKALWYLEYCGVKLRYQRLGWKDLIRPEPSKVTRYLEMAGANVAAGEGLIVHGPIGCLQGDAEMQINRGGKGYATKLVDLVEKFNGGGGRYTWKPEIDTYIQREVDGRVRLARVVNAWCSGIKQTYTVITDTGRTLRATDEHPFLTERGWLRLDELVPGDLVHVRGEQGDLGRGVKPRYAYLNGMAHHPYRQTTEGSKDRVWVHRLVAEADLSGLSYEEFLERLTLGKTEELVFLDPDVWAVHHDDRDSFNNVLSNLKVMTHPDHHRLHALEGAGNNVLIKVITETVVSVEPWGQEMTYDLEVEGEPHNFLANGFVVHNTGKTLLCNLIAKDLVSKGFDAYVCTLFNLMQRFQSGFHSEESRQWFYRRIRNAKVLIIDDVGREHQRSATKEEVAAKATKGDTMSSNFVLATLEEVVRHRVAAAMPTIITTNLELGEINQKYRANLFSLLTECTATVQFIGADVRSDMRERGRAEVNAGMFRPIVFR